MKTKILLALMAAISLFWLSSCEEGLTTEVSTTLDKDITASVVEEDALLKNGTMEKTDSLFPFLEMDTINLEDNDDLKDDLELIKSGKVEKIMLTIKGVPPHVVLQATSIAIAHFDEIVIDAIYLKNDLETELQIDASKLQEIADELLATKKAPVKVHGKVKGGYGFDITFKLKFICKFEVELE